MSYPKLAIFFGCTFLVFLILPSMATSYVLNLVERPDGSHISRLIERHKIKNPTLHTRDFYEGFAFNAMRRLVVVLSSALALVLMARFRQAFNRFLAFSTTPFNVGVFRIVVMLQMLMFNFSSLLKLPSMAVEDMNFPLGWDWLANSLPPSQEFVSNLILGYRLLALAGLLGIYTSWSISCLAVFSFFMLLGPHLAGKMNHYHHLWLMTAILACFPCGDALSVDALVRRLRGVAIDPHQPSTRYGRVMVYSWIVMGWIYFFPGIWKFLVGGFAWAISDNVLLKIRLKMFELSTSPLIPVYDYPILCKLGGLAVLLFEVGFPLAMIFPYWRKIFAWAGVAFHESVRLTMQISFTSLEFFYISFLDWSSLLNPHQPKAPTIEKIPLWKDGICSVIVSGMFVAGVLAFDGWPFALYPHFASIEPRFVQSIEMRVYGNAVKDFRSILIQKDPALIEDNLNGVELRSLLMKIMLTSDDQSRHRMISDLFGVWQRSNTDCFPVRVEFWQVEVSLVTTTEFSPVKNLGELIMTSR